MSADKSGPPGDDDSGATPRPPTSIFNPSGSPGGVGGDSTPRPSPSTSNSSGSPGGDDGDSTHGPTPSTFNSSGSPGNVGGVPIPFAFEYWGPSVQDENDLFTEYTGGSRFILINNVFRRARSIYAPGLSNAPGPSNPPGPNSVLGFSLLNTPLRPSYSPDVVNNLFDGCPPIVYSALGMGSYAKPRTTSSRRIVKAISELNFEDDNWDH
ncbi:hypothetical protein QBC35DRAFT_45318 [Podospora australis]|uniref:Uncharacterized protein n=1 Tax=Podospora australis TaxID=1536484 RepID=A0AAN6X400_9PEZI|nr:hypothetical protein QBC35DRAFT_45318 [Podospora australis]